MYSFPGCNLQPVCCSMSNSNCCFLTCIQVSQEASQVVWYFHFLKNFPVCCDPYRKGFGIVNKAKVDFFFFLELSCFFDYPTDVGHLISGSSAFSKSSLNVWKVHVLLKLGLENFEHYFTSVWDKCNVQQFQHSLTLLFFGIGMKTDFFQSCGHCWVFQIYWHIEGNTFTASSFRIWSISLHFYNSSVRPRGVLGKNRNAWGQGSKVHKHTVNQ